MVLSPTLSLLWGQYACVLWVLYSLVLVSVLPEEVYVNKIAVHISGGHHEAERLAREAGLLNLGQVGTLEDHYLFEIPHRQKRSIDKSHAHHKYLSDHPKVHWFEQQVAKSRKKRDLTKRAPVQGKEFKLNDPYYNSQWYLHGGGKGGFDMNVIDAWRKGVTGKNIVVSILDDGIERDHPDLQVNYDPYASYDVNNRDNDPMPRYDPTNENRHGTRCAGEVSASANNSNCAVGIAYNSKIGGVRMLDGEVFDAVEAASLSFNRTHIDIYSASWGPDDDGRVVDGPGPLAKKAFEDGIKMGRGGKGSIFVWASGNGGSAQDSCNCDGYANSIYTLSISSTSERGQKPWYLEECSSTLATTYSSGAYNERQIVTVDLHKRCTQSHTGTSASAPLAAGIVALILEANPDLTWRDVQFITLMTSRPEPMVDGQWITNALGRKVSLRYGYGLMDASRMVDLAQQWRNVPEKHICQLPSGQQDVRLSNKKFISTLTTTGCQGESSEVRFLEHVQCRVSLAVRVRGSIILHLVSPMGTRSTILPRRPNDLSPAGFNDWPFLSVHFWGEDPRGEWKLEIENGNSYPSYHPDTLDGGVLVRWGLMLHGTKDQPVRLKNETSNGRASPTKNAVNIISTMKPTTSTAKTSPKPTISKEKCHAECKDGCTGTGPNHCKACLHFTCHKDQESVCVSECPKGTYTDGKTCKECGDSCLTCTGPTVVQCLSCHPGAKFHPKHNTCADDCMVGTYSDNVHCLPCDASCKSCSGGREDQCLECKVHHKLEGGHCLQSWVQRMEGSMQSLVLVLVLLCTVLLLTIAIGVAMIARRQKKLCWASSRYNKLPCHDEDEDAKVSMTYANGIDFEDDLRS